MHEHPEDQSSLGQALGPTLCALCDGRLSDIRWFTATWQHGGAATGFATWRFPDGRTVPCVVKLPVGFGEYFWTKRLGLTSWHDWDRESVRGLCTPRVLAAGFELGAYDLAWIVMERFPGSPVGATPSRQCVWEIIETAAEFHAAAQAERPVEPERAPASPDWQDLIARALPAVIDNELADTARWVRLLERTAEHAPRLCRRWDERPIDTWCHRDVHGRNAMRRAHPDGDEHGRCVLIDLALVSPGLWVEDALYLERLHWGHADRLFGIDPVAALARAREYLGLPVDPDDLALADVRRLLMAASVPAFLRTEADPVYLAAALDTLDRLLPTVVGAG
jgi:hypothetical protein